MPWWVLDDMAVSRVPVIRSWRVEFHHLFSIRRGARHNLHLSETVEAQMIMQPLPQGGIGFHREYAPARTNERGHEQRMPTDIRTDVKRSAPQRQDPPEYPSYPGS